MDNTELFGFLLQVRTTAHLLHFKTKSYAKHIALEEFYTELLELTDTLIETYQGINNIAHILVKDSSSSDWDEPVDFLRYVIDAVSINRKNFTRESQLNVIDDILTLSEKTLYKLTHLN